MFDTPPPAGVQDGSSVEVLVTYTEVDKMGVAGYGNYLRWFEMGRAELLRTRGGCAKEIEKEGISLPLVEAYVRYRQAARCDERIRIRSWPVETDRARIRLGHVVERIEDGTLLAEGYTVHACRGPSGRVRRLPAALLDLLRPSPTCPRPPLL